MDHKGRGPTVWGPKGYMKGGGPEGWGRPEGCKLGGIVGGDEGPIGGVAQVVCHGLKVHGVHGEEGREEDGEMQGEVKGEVEENQGQPHMCMA